MNATAAAAAPPMPSLKGRNHELWVGLFVLAGLAAVLYVLFTLTSPSLLRGRTILSTLVPNAGGIRKGDPVRMRGVNIGRVRGFDLAPQGVRISLEVDRGYSVPSDSSVQLKGVGLLGEMVADVMPGSSPAPARAGQELPGQVAPGPFGAATGLAQQASKTLEKVQGLLNERTIDNLESSTEALNQSLKDLAGFASDERVQIRELTDSLRRSAHGLEGAVNSPKLAQSIARLDDLTTRLDSMAGSLSHSAASAETVLGRIEHGEGTLGMLTRDDSLYVNANAAVANLNRAAAQITELTADIRKEPKRFLKISVF